MVLLDYDDFEHDDKDADNNDGQRDGFHLISFVEHDMSQSVALIVQMPIMNDLVHHECIFAHACIIVAWLMFFFVFLDVARWSLYVNSGSIWFAMFPDYYGLL